MAYEFMKNKRSNNELNAVYNAPSCGRFLAEIYVSSQFKILDKF